jgi:hypothetical protein
MIKAFDILAKLSNVDFTLAFCHFLVLTKENQEKIMLPSIG